MMVVCAGAKSILDIPRTLEVLETHGVAVATFGERPDFPAFYTPSSGCLSPWHVRSISEAANLACEFESQADVRHWIDPAVAAGDAACCPHPGGIQ